MVPEIYSLPQAAGYVFETDGANGQMEKISKMSNGVAPELSDGHGTSPEKYPKSSVRRRDFQNWGEAPELGFQKHESHAAGVF